MHKVPGGLGIANVFACALFAAMAGSSPATCSAIGSAGIPEMRNAAIRAPSPPASLRQAARSASCFRPPSPCILYAVAAEQSLGRLFLAGLGPGLLLVVLFAGYAMIRFRQEYAAAKIAYERTGRAFGDPRRRQAHHARPLRGSARVLPFVILLTGVMVALYGGYATPSETAGLAAFWRSG